MTDEAKAKEAFERHFADLFAEMGIDLTWIESAGRYQAEAVEDEYATFRLGFRDGYEKGTAAEREKALRAGHHHLCKAAEPHLWIHDGSTDDCRLNEHETYATCEAHRELRVATGRAEQARAAALREAKETVKQVIADWRELRPVTPFHVKYGSAVFEDATLAALDALAPDAAATLAQDASGDATGHPAGETAQEGGVEAQDGVSETVTDCGDGRFRVESLECPKCGSTETRVINKADLICCACGEWSNPYDSPSVKRAMEAVKAAESEVKGWKKLKSS